MSLGPNVYIPAQYLSIRLKYCLVYDDDLKFNTQHVNVDVTAPSWTVDYMFEIDIIPLSFISTFNFCSVFYSADNFTKNKYRRYSHKGLSLLQQNIHIYIQETTTYKCMDGKGGWFCV